MLAKIIRYFKRVIIALDQLVNTIFWGLPDETISSRVGKAYRNGEDWAGVARNIIDLLLGRDHCVNSIEADEWDDPSKE